MASDPFTDLQRAREQLVKRRRHVAQALAGEYTAGHTDDMTDQIVKLQAAIEAVDYALDDEQDLAATTTKGPRSTRRPYQSDSGED